MSCDDLAPDAVAQAPDGCFIERQIKCLDTVIALYDFPGTQPAHLRLDIGDTICVLLKNESGWWDGVITRNTGKIFRGWFPENYVRSVNYVQPALNKLHTNKEIDFITAANTAANVRIPLFSSLLQKNSVDHEKRASTATSRKNSVVSFALSEVSIPSSKTSQRPVKADRDDALLDKKESNATSHPFVVQQPFYASTVYVPDSYASSCNTQSSSLPSAAHTTGCNSEFVKLKSLWEVEALVADIKRSSDENIFWLPCVTDLGDVVYYSERLGVYCATHPVAPMTASDCSGGFATMPSVAALQNTSLVCLLDTAPFYAAENVEPSRSDLSIAKSAYETAKRDSEASLLSLSSSASYHHFGQPFYITPGLFYEHPTDISYWKDLRERFSFLLDLTLKVLHDSNKQLFTMHFSQLAKLISIVMSAARLTQADFIDTPLEKAVRRKLRRLSEAFAQMYINGLLHLRVMLHSQETPSVDNLNIPNFNSSAATMSHYRVSHDSTGTLTSRTSSHETASTRQGLVADDTTRTYMHQIDEDVPVIRSTMNSLISIFLKLSSDKKVYKRDYDASDTLEDEGEDRSNVLPQVYPRFITKEFNGGNWCNPFFSAAHKALNLSGDQLKNKYHHKVIIDASAHDRAKSFSEELRKVSSKALDYFDPAALDRCYNESFLNERNEHVLRVMYRYLHHASTFIELVESLDFTLFCLIKRYPSFDSDGEPKEVPSARHKPLKSSLTFEYPIVLDFFHLKHKLHNLFARIITQSQALTLEDPDAFTAMKDDDVVVSGRESIHDPLETPARLLGNFLMKQIQPQAQDRFALNVDVVVHELLCEANELCESVCEFIKLLVDERETVLNYATRVMHDDFNVDLFLIESNNTTPETRADDSGGQYFSGKTRNDSTPWYLQGDEEHDLLLDVNGNIKGGTKEALVAHLTHHEVLDASFTTVFLTTFATMLTLAELLRLLINRFMIEAPEGLSYEEYFLWRQTKQSKIRIKVLNVMKVLLEKHWCDSYKSHEILHDWLEFLELQEVQTYPVAEVLVKDIRRILNNEDVVERVIPQLTGKAPAQLTKSFSLRKIKLADIEYVELARQLTLREFDLFRKITSLAVIHKVWGKKLGLRESLEHIFNFIKASNHLTNFVVYMIVRKEDQRKRVQVIRFFVNVAEKCRQYNNYSSMTAIISALYSSPIHRLKKTWSLVSRDTLAKLENMNKLMNSSRNFNEYRDMLKFSTSEPSVPFFGVFLSDLTFVYHGNPDHLLKRSRMINFAKRAKTTEIVLGMERFKELGFNFVVVPEIQLFLDYWFNKCPTIQDLYQISLVLEPREDLRLRTSTSLLQ